jgi:hypothetical protein
MLLAYQGQLAFLLDGWNELTPEARLRATRDLNALQRDYPLLGIIISSRRRVLPADGPIVTLDELSHEQQYELAKAVRGGDGTSLLVRAWRTPGVRDLIGNPLEQWNPTCAAKVRIVLAEKSSRMKPQYLCYIS